MNFYASFFLCFFCAFSTARENEEKNVKKKSDGKVQRKYTLIIHYNVIHKFFISSFGTEMGREVFFERGKVCL